MEVLLMPCQIDTEQVIKINNTWFQTLNLNKIICNKNSAVNLFVYRLIYILAPAWISMTSLKILVSKESSNGDHLSNVQAITVTISKTINVEE